MSLDTIDYIRQHYRYRPVSDLIRQAKALEKQADDWITMGFQPNGNWWREQAASHRQVADERINGLPIPQPTNLHDTENSPRHEGMADIQPRSHPHRPFRLGNTPPGVITMTPTYLLPLLDSLLTSEGGTLSVVYKYNEFMASLEDARSMPCSIQGNGATSAEALENLFKVYSAIENNPMMDKALRHLTNPNPE